MENILKSVNASLSTINSTLFQELISVGTDFESKVSVGIKNNLSDFPYSRWKMLNYLLSGTDFPGIMKHYAWLETNKFLMKKKTCSGGEPFGSFRKGTREVNSWWSRKNLSSRLERTGLQHGTAIMHCTSIK